MEDVFEWRRKKGFGEDIPESCGKGSALKKDKSRSRCSTGGDIPQIKKRWKSRRNGEVDVLEM